MSVCPCVCVRLYVWEAGGFRGGGEGGRDKEYEIGDED